MTRIDTNDDILTVMVTFKLEKKDQQNVVELVTHYIEKFVSKQSGFISGNVHKSLCGHYVTNYAQWKSMADFEAFGAKAKKEPLLKELVQYKPRAVFYEVPYINKAP